MNDTFASANWGEDTPEWKREAQEKEFRAVAAQKTKADKRAEFIAAMGPFKELKSDYLGTSSYFYNVSQNKIYEYDNYTWAVGVPSKEVEERLRVMNSLPLA